MKDTPVILALDTSLGPCSVAVLKDGKLVAAAEEKTPGRQSRVLVPMIESALSEAGIAYDDCDAVACTVGPGGFTGIRVGLATARAIALGANRPLIGLSTLEVLAWGAGIKGDMLAIIDAHRGQYYVQRFRMNGNLAPQSDVLLVEEKAIATLAHGAKTVQGALSAKAAATLAEHKWLSGERNFPVAPMYVREPDAKHPSSEGLKCAGELL